MPSFSELWPILLILLLLFGAKRLPGLAKAAGSKVGKTAGEASRKARWIWSSVAGNEEESITAERAMGREMAKAVLEEERTPDDPDLKTLLDGIVAKLSTGSRTRNHRFEVATLAGDLPNASALPGGFLFLTPPLVALTRRDPDELAAVIAHEMSHVILRHSIERVLSQQALAVISLATPTTRAIAPWMRKIGIQWFERAYSREQEFEADRLGLALVSEAGFDPSAAIRILERFRGFSAPSGATGLEAYFSTHPPIDDRVQRLTEQLARSDSLKATSSNAPPHAVA